MLISANKKQFLEAFTAASAAVPSRTPKDILRNVLMSVRKGQMELVATDQEHAVRVVVRGVTCSEDGDILLPTQRVSQILRELPDEQFDLNASDSNLTIKGASSKFRLTSEDAREFPPVPEFTQADFFRVSAPVFRSMIRRTSFATDPSSTRYALGGLLFEFTSGTFHLAATDSRRLAVCNTVVELIGEPKDTTRATVVPVKSMQILERSIDPQEQHADIAIQDNSVLIRSGGITVYSRLVEGRFPRWRDVIPKGGELLALPVGPFFAAVRQSQIITDEESRGVDFTFGQSLLTLGSSANSIGESKIELPINFDHPDVRIVFDPKYVGDFLKVLEPSAVCELRLIDGDNAAVFEFDGSYRYVVMPLSNDR